MFDILDAYPRTGSVFILHELSLIDKSWPIVQENKPQQAQTFHHLFVEVGAISLIRILSV